MKMKCVINVNTVLPFFVLASLNWLGLGLDFPIYLQIGVEPLLLLTYVSVFFDVFVVTLL